ncbi:MAG: DUF488 domain-containing protein [Candidatus Bathyarchaeia archaeon]
MYLDGAPIMIVYTIGCWGRTISEFIKILKENNITTVIDIRRFPRSSNADFSRENLERILEDHGIKYVFLGESLGGFVRGGYEKYMETEKFKEGLNTLIEIAGREVVALMCKERNVKFCHRRFIIQRLEGLGINVKNL